MMRMGIYASGKKTQHVTRWRYARRQMEPPDVSPVQIITQYVKKKAVIESSVNAVRPHDTWLYTLKPWCRDGWKITVFLEMLQGGYNVQYVNKIYLPRGRFRTACPKTNSPLLVLSRTVRRALNVHWTQIGVTETRCWSRFFGQCQATNGKWNLSIYYVL